MRRKSIRAPEPVSFDLSGAAFVIGPALHFRVLVDRFAVGWPSRVRSPSPYTGAQVGVLLRFTALRRMLRGARGLALGATLLVAGLLLPGSLDPPLDAAGVRDELGLTL